MKQRMISTQLTTSKILLGVTIASLVSIPNALIADTVNYGNLGIKLIPFTIKEKTSVYQIATRSNLTIEQLNNLNRNQIRGRKELSVGETIFIPSDSTLAKGNNGQLAKTNGLQVNDIEATPALVDKPTTDVDFGIVESNRIKSVNQQNEQVINNSQEDSEVSSLEGVSLSKLISDEPSQAKVTEQTEASGSISMVQAPVQNSANGIILNENVNQTQSNTSIANNNAITTQAKAVSALAVTKPTQPIEISQSSQKNQQSEPLITAQNAPNNNNGQNTQFVAVNSISSTNVIESSNVTAANHSSQSTPDSRALTNKIEQTVSNQVQNALNRFGTAQVDLNLDEKAKFKSLNFNILGNLYETEDGLFFAQVGANNQGEGIENRTIGNLGLGYRHDLDTLRVGANAFIDQDFSNNHTRMSVGAEAAADYLSLSSNFYAPISGWKQSDIIDTRTGESLKERAAKGYDINANFYLPQHPQLGGGLLFEQYFGDAVGLFSENERQKNPSAFGASIHYTPVPLVTAKATHKIGNSGKNDTTLNVDVNLQLGRPIAEQLDPMNVAELRTLKGSKYDIVNRNYSIVYEYEAEAGQVVIAGPKTANVNEIVQIQPSLTQGVIAKSYTWYVISPTGNHEYLGEHLALPISQVGQYAIKLAVETQDNQIKMSNQLYIDANYINNTHATLSFDKQYALASINVDSEPFVTAIDANQRIILTFDLPGEVSLNQNDTPSLLWKSSSSGICSNWCDLSQGNMNDIRYEVNKNQEGDFIFHVIGSESLIETPIQFSAAIMLDGVEYKAVTDGEGQFN
ncbi:inverse autotransporter beta domain-containing protein [Thorsellia anophelis]|uniref:Invasin beta-domain of outer membrane n=1 Tax=Thorsellia anophelis DSM 18579 TaxID=1123402 RepID=A0A1I0DKK8_9GAMM|nr:inverse autotransporter beta domain-containing protein [Thorsellia anophelis]SET32997.1 Invasin beta-domain of outer membrane [Thorsellia anophelis DSM 18579]